MSAAAGKYTLAATWLLAAALAVTTPGVLAQVTVSLTGPANGTNYVPPVNVTISATASAGSGYTISKVEFFYGTTLIGTDTTSPYAVVWNNAPSGQHVLTAKATAIKKSSPNATATSNAASITVNMPPTITLTSPADESSYTIPPSIALAATAADSDGAITKVEFVRCDGSLSVLATVTAPPYSYTWTPPGPYWIESLQRYRAYGVDAYAYDNLGGRTQSSTGCLFIYLVPAVALPSPANGATYTAPASITLNAAVTPPDGPLHRIEFYSGTTLIDSVSTPPYSINWANVPVGSYSLTAKIIFNSSVDNHDERTSAPVNVTVTPGVAKLHFIHVDHLDTPRLVANDQGQAVWRWDQQEPFGVNGPVENPSGLGTFEFPLRFPGQYFDKETNIAYNGARDFDPTSGRFVQSDPLGLQAGINPYVYALATPLSAIDPFGLISCITNPPNFNSAGCALSSKSDRDREEIGNEQATDERMLVRTRLPDYRWGVSGSRPDKKQHGGGMPLRPNYYVAGYFVFEFWYTKYTTHRRVVTDFTELWQCKGECGRDDTTQRVVTTCYGDWAPYTHRTRYWWRNYYESAQ